MDGPKINLVNPHACQEYSKCYNFRFSAYVIRVLNFHFENSLFIEKYVKVNKLELQN